MKDEIKEILSEMCHIIWKYGDDFDDLEENEIRYQLPYKQMEKLYDYITNLQEENERLKENAIHNDKVVDKARWNEMIYKSRNEKAIEYINSCTWSNGIDKEIQYSLHIPTLLNILQGDDKE